MEIKSGGQALGDTHLTLLRASYCCAYICVVKCGVRNQKERKEVIK